MNFSEAIKSGYRHYFRLRGRATRPEYWYFVLFSLLLNMAARVFLILARHQDITQRLVFDLIALSISLIALSAAIPAITLQVRRLHDSGHSGWWVLSQLIVFTFAAAILIAGAIAHVPPMILLGALLGAASVILGLIILFFLVQPSDRNDNQYGA
jgi:uncharacterized membrane protein YhaH (DUF805 family)